MFLTLFSLAFNIHARPAWKDGSDSGSGGAKGGGKGKKATTEKIQVTTAPLSQTVEEGSSIYFSVDAQSSTGSDLTYQWRFNGVNIELADAPSYNIPSAMMSDAGNYSVYIAGATATKELFADLIVNAAPPMSDMTILSQPVSVNAIEGERAQFSVYVSSSNVVAYQWRKDGINISGANAPVYEMSSTALSNAGNYDVVLDDGIVMLNSNTATLLVAEAAPVSDMIINSHPVSLVAMEGDNVQFSVQVSSSNAVSYQWRKDGVDIVGANAFSFELSQASTADAGSYDVVVSDGIESLLSERASLDVDVPTVTVSSLNLSWLAPELRDDGSILDPQEIAEYKVYMSVVSHGLDEVFSVDASQLNLKLADLPSGDYEFKISTIDVDGLEGASSDLVNFSL